MRLHSIWNACSTFAKPAWHQNVHFVFNLSYRMGWGEALYLIVAMYSFVKCMFTHKGLSYVVYGMRCFWVWWMIIKIDHDQLIHNLEIKLVKHRLFVLKIIILLINVKLIHLVFCCLNCISFKPCSNLDI